MMLQINNLHARVAGKDILQGIDLTIQPGEVHAIMGPNGSGKSTLSHLMTGRDGYDITQGELLFEGKDISELAVDERAREGIFLAFQYPAEIPGVGSMSFVRSAVNAVRKHRGEEELDSAAFLKLAKQTAKDLGMDPSLLKRAVNSGFSGGEKKRFDILQMTMLEPKFCILDETDSGLDIDALRHVADAVNRLRSPERSMLVITHYQRLLDYIKPDVVHILADGKIVTSGGFEIAERLEKDGYQAFGIRDEEAA